MERIRSEIIRQKLTTPEAAASFIKNGMTVGMSGFTGIGYPKVIPGELAKRKEAGEDLKITVICGASMGDQSDGVMARAGIVSRRYGFQSNKDMRAAINRGEIQFVDMHLSQIAYWMKAGYFGKVDVAVIEVAGVTEDGSLICPCAVGIIPTLVKCADKIILEVNDMVPEAVEGLHDIIDLDLAPNTQPIMITSPGQRVGTPYVKCDPDKIIAVIRTADENMNAELKAPDDDMIAIAEHIVNFFHQEIAAGRLPNPLPPLQSGVGGVANAVLSQLAKSDLENLTVYTEVAQDAVFDLMDAGKVLSASATSMTLSPSIRAGIYARLADYKGRLVLRPQEISNAPEVIKRLGVIAMNTAIEFDLEGNVNSTHVGGTSLMNGLGGSGDFARGSGLSIFTTASTAKAGTLSCLVPHVSHVDHTEHDTQIIVTEQGLADLRGLTAYERADLLIERCAHPKFKAELREFVAESRAKAKAFHALAR